MAMSELETPRFMIQTLGCKVNQYDSERIRAQLVRGGYRSVLVEEDVEPDLIVINTCSVTSESDRKGRQMIRKLIRRYPQARVVVTGCYSERKPEEIQRIDGVHEIVPIEGQELWVERIVEELGWGCEDQNALWNLGQGIEHFEEHTRAFVKIQDGCDLKCTFCSIPQSRGKARSRPLAEVLEECEQLVQHDYPEIVLCGICIGQYGKDLNLELHDLVRAVADTPGIQRVRISSLEPQHASDELFVAMKDRSDVICSHLHLPLQSGSNKILRRMNRPYTVEYFQERVQSARELIPDFELSTDIMVGFPEESERDLEQSVKAVRQCQFNKVHLFRYSAREDTPALRMKGHLPPEIVEQHRRELERVAVESAKAVQQRYVGRTMEVLMESLDGRQGTGFTRNYLRVDFRTAQQSLERKSRITNEMLSVKIHRVHHGRLMGEAVESF